MMIYNDTFSFYHCLVKNIVMRYFLTGKYLANSMHLCTQSMLHSFGFINTDADVRSLLFAMTLCIG